MFESILPRDEAARSSMIMPNLIYYRDPKYDLIPRKSVAVLKKTNTLDMRIINPSKNYDGFVIASHKKIKPTLVFRTDPKNVINPINRKNKRPSPITTKVNFLNLKNGVDSNVSSDVKQKPTFQVYVQTIRQVYKRMINDITTSEQQILNDALDTFQKEYINKKNNMNQSQLDSLLNNYISKVSEVFTTWYESSDKSFNPILTVESGTVLDDIQTNNDELIQTLKDRDNREENLLIASAQSDLDALQEAQDLLDEETKKKTADIANLIKENNEKLKVEKQKRKDIEGSIKEQKRLLDQADALILTETKQKTKDDDRKVAIDDRLAVVASEYKDTSTISDTKIRIATREALTKENDDLESEKTVIDNRYLTSVNNVTDIEAKKLLIAQEQKDKIQERKDQIAKIQQQQNDDKKETDKLKAVEEKERLEKEAKLEKEAEPILKGLAKFNADRTARNTLIQKIAPLKDSVSDDRLQEIYDNLPKEYRDPENANLNAKYREALRKTFKDIDNVVISNDERRVIYKNNYDRFLDLVKSNYRPTNLNENIFNAITGSKININEFKKEFEKIIKSKPQKVDIESYKRYATNMLGGMPKPSKTIKMSGKKSGKSKYGFGRKKQLSKSLKDVLKKYNL
jgi:hypothetical protein